TAPLFLAPKLDREKTVAILGTSKKADTHPHLLPYFQVLEGVSRSLSKKGYNIITGATTGANYYGNLGADPDKSFAIHVEGWDSVKNLRPDGSPLYRDYAVAKSGSARTALINQSSKFVILSPGGPGSLQEAAVTLENMYYKTPGNRHC